MDKPVRAVETEAERWRRFGRYVKNFREDTAKLTQIAAAAKLKMARQQLSRIEKGTSGSKRSTIIKIAEGLGGDPVDFLNQAGFQEVGEQTPLLSVASGSEELEERRLLRFYRDLPPDCKEDVLALTEALWKRRRGLKRALDIQKSREGKHEVEVDYPQPARRVRRRRIG